MNGAHQGADQMAGTTRTSLAIGVGAIVILLIGLYLYSPFLALDRLGHAVRTGDRDQLSTLVDFPAVRTGLKDQFSGLIEKRVGEDREVKHNPIASFVLTLVPLVLDKVVDAIVTPDGIAELLRRPIGDHSQAAHGRSKKWNRSWSFVDLVHFKAAFSDPDDPRIVFGLLFEERGFFSWRLVRLDLPGDELARRFQGAGESSLENGGAEGLTSGDNGANTALPERVGACAVVVVKQVTTRL